jgi:signal peptidase II
MDARSESAAALPNRFLFGPLTLVGAVIAAVVCALDQATKFWLISVFDLGGRGPVALLPVLDLRLIWNTGISYGLLQQTTVLGSWALLLVKVVATVLLWVWLARTRSYLTAVSLGLIIGGAVGNGIDAVAHGAVADFVHFHVGRFSWFVFNLADAAIVAGVAGLLYHSFLGEGAAKAP